MRTAYQAKGHHNWTIPYQNAPTANAGDQRLEAMTALLHEMKMKIPRLHRMLETYANPRRLFLHKKGLYMKMGKHGFLKERRESDRGVVHQKLLGDRLMRILGLRGLILTHQRTHRRNFRIVRRQQMPVLSRQRQ